MSKKRVAQQYMKKTKASEKAEINAPKLSIKNICFGFEMR